MKNLKIQSVVALLNVVKDIPNTQILTSNYNAKTLSISVADKDIATLPTIKLQNDKDITKYDFLHLTIKFSNSQIVNRYISKEYFEKDSYGQVLSIMIKDIYELAKQGYIKQLKDFAEQGLGLVAK
jgi:hypothetical protein